MLGKIDIVPIGDPLSGTAQVPQEVSPAGGPVAIKAGQIRLRQHGGLPSGDRSSIDLAAARSRF